MSDEKIMRRAIELARTAAGWTNPNPLVGAVVVKDGRIIGEGCHERYGEKHAERNALATCSEDPQGATIYVTLEPCNHTGKQPPCVDALIEAGVARVVVGSRDPNPLVSGKGNARLRAAGIEVETDFLREECDALNPVFFHFITTGRPFVVAKWAMSADGKIACATGDARWVSSEESRADVHELRQRLAGIMVGINTVLADDPLLTCRREVPSNNPVRIVCDSHLRIPERCALFSSLDEAPVVIATAEDGNSDKARRLIALGAEIISVPDAQGRVDLTALMRQLGTRNIDSVLLEGGATLNAAAFAADLVDEVIVYLAPKIIAGTEAKSPVGGIGAAKMADAVMLGTPSLATLGDDVKLVYTMKRGR